MRSGDSTKEPLTFHATGRFTLVASFENREFGSVPTGIPRPGRRRERVVEKD